MFLAPLYDVLSYVPYHDDQHERRRLRMAMKIGGYQSSQRSCRGIGDARRN
ncbi:hypothetical protein EAV90_22780 [Bradyrhizobium vignae]|nr:hypothetical protein EAV90_22780 [Bradyrhizobium vignae]